MASEPGTSKKAPGREVFPYLLRRLVIMLEACHAREVIELTVARWGTPEIVNSDQGSQFTATEFADAVLDQGCQLSMDERGAWRDIVFVERQWRSVKCERVYLKASDSVSAARADIADHIAWYDAARTHSILADATPGEHCFTHLPTLVMAA